MRFLLTVLVTVGICIGVLRTDLTPWRIVAKSELESNSNAYRTSRLPLNQPSGDHSGNWMHNPNYRSALEKTTVIGRPEPAGLRETQEPAPKP